MSEKLPESMESTAPKKAGIRGVMRRIGAFTGAAFRVWVGMGPRERTLEDLEATRRATETGVRFGRFAQVSVVLLLLLAVTWLLAYFLMASLLAVADPSLLRSIQLGTVGVSFAFFLTGLKDILLAFQSLLKFVRTGGRDELAADYVKFGATSLALAAAVFSILLAPAAETGQSSAPPQVAAPSSSARVVYLVPSPARAEYFHYVFERADGPPAWRRGVGLSEAQLKDIRQLAVSLKACVGTLPNQDVIVEIAGFADTNEFEGLRGSGAPSDEANRQTANRRAEALAAALRDALGEATTPSTVVIAKVTQWPESDPLAMRRSSRYLSTRPVVETGEGRDQGLFNRRAEIALIRAGVCERYQAR